jgi:hypothetical protein
VADAPAALQDLRDGALEVFLKFGEVIKDIFFALEGEQDGFCVLAWQGWQTLKESDDLFQQMGAAPDDAPWPGSGDRWGWWCGNGRRRCLVTGARLAYEPLYGGATAACPGASLCGEAERIDLRGFEALGFCLAEREVAGDDFSIGRVELGNSFVAQPAIDQGRVYPHQPGQARARTCAFAQQRREVIAK